MPREEDEIEDLGEVLLDAHQRVRVHPRHLAQKAACLLGIHVVVEHEEAPRDLLELCGNVGPDHEATEAAPLVDHGHHAVLGAGGAGVGDAPAVGLEALDGVDHRRARGAPRGDAIHVRADRLLFVRVGQERAICGEDPHRQREEVIEAAADLGEGAPVDDLLEAADLTHHQLAGTFIASPRQPQVAQPQPDPPRDAC